MGKKVRKPSMSISDFVTQGRRNTIIEKNGIKDYYNILKSDKYAGRKLTKEQDDFLEAYKEQEIIDTFLARQEEALKKQKQAEKLRKANLVMKQAETTWIGNFARGLFQNNDENNIWTNGIRKDDKGNFVNANGKILSIDEVNKQLDEYSTNMASGSGYAWGKGVNTALATTWSSVVKGTTDTVPAILRMAFNNPAINMVEGIVRNVVSPNSEKTKEFNSAIKKQHLGWASMLSGAFNRVTGGTDLTNSLEKKIDNSLAQITKEEKKKGKVFKTSADKAYDAIFDNENASVEEFLNRTGNYVSSFGKATTDKDYQNAEDTYRELLQIANGRAMALEGRNKTDLFDDSQLPELSKKTVKVNGQEFQEEISETGNKWDTKVLQKNPDGSVMTDANGNPIYYDKYGIGEKLMNVKGSFLFDKYSGGEELFEGIGNLLGFVGLGGGIGKAVGKTVNAASRAAQASSALNKVGNLASKIGKATGLAGTKASKIVKKVLSEEGISTMLSSYLLTNSESQIIGDDTYKNIYNSIIDKHANINAKEIQQELVEKYPNIDSRQLELMTMQEIHKRKIDFEKDENNEEIVNQAILSAKQGKDLAITNNNTLGFLINLSSANLFTPKQSLARNILNKPLSKKGVKKGLKTVVTESGQEFIEEGFINQFAQKSGEYLGKDSKFSFQDYIENDLLSTESLHSGFIGALLGGGQTSLTLGAQLKSNNKRYKEQQKALKSLEEFRALSKDDLKMFITHAFDMAVNKELEAKISKAEEEGDIETVNDLRDNQLLYKAVTSAITGTSGVFTDTLVEMMKSEEYTPEEKQNIQKAIEFNNVIADTHDKYNSFFDRNSILLNRGNKYLLEQKQKDYQEIFDGRKQEFEKYIEREAIKQIGQPTLFEEESYNDKLEEKKKELRQKQDNIYFEALQEAHNALNKNQEQINNLDSELDILTSSKYQKNYSKKIGKHLLEQLAQSATSENTQEVKEEIIEKSVEENLPITSKVLSDINDKVFQSEKNAQPTEKESRDFVNKYDEDVALFDENEIVSEEGEKIITPGSNPSLDSKIFEMYGGTGFKVDNIISSVSGNQQSDNSQEIEEDLEESTPFHAPIIIKDSPQDNQIIDAMAENIFSGLDNDATSFKNVVAVSASESPTNTDAYYNHMVKAYNKVNPNNQISEKQAQDIYNSIFGSVSSRKQIFDMANKILPRTINETTPINENESKGLLEPENEIQKQEPQIKHHIEGVAEKKKVTKKRFKIDRPDIKAGFLGARYKINPDGTYSNADENVLEDAHPILHYNNFKPGDKVTIDFNINFLVDNPVITIYTDSGRNNKKLRGLEEIYNHFFKGSEITFDHFQKAIIEGNIDALIELFENNESFLQYFPTSFNLENGASTNFGINVTNWYNAENVGLEDNQDAQKELIDEARHFNLTLRRTMLENLKNGEPSVTLKVSDRQDNFRNRKANPKENFQSIEESFKGDDKAAQENVTFGFFKNETPLSEIRDGKPILNIGGKEVTLTPENSNIVPFIEAYRQNNRQLNGTSFMVVPEGTTREGEPKYIITTVTNDHASNQKKINSISYVRNIIQALLNNQRPDYLIRNANLEEIFNNSDKYREALLKFFEDRGLKEQIQDLLSIDNYVIRAKKDAEGNIIKGQNYINVTASSKGHQQVEIIDLSDFSGDISFANFLRNLVNNKLDEDAPQPRKITRQEFYVKNLHTPLIFNKVGDGTGNVQNDIWTSSIQPTVTFEVENENYYKKLSEVSTEENKQTEKEKVISKLKKDIETTKKTLISLKIYAEQANTADNSDFKQAIEDNQRVLDNLINKYARLTGKIEEQTQNEEQINENSQEDEKLEEVTKTLENIKFDEDDIFKIGEFILYKALSKIDFKETFNKQTILNIAENLLEEYIQELRNKGLKKEAVFLEKNRRNILGNFTDSRYENSISEIIDNIFDLKSDEEFDFNNFFEKDYSKQSFENDIQTSLSLKVKMKLAGIVDNRQSNEGNFANIPEYFTMKDTLDYLQQALSELSNKNMEELKAWIDEKLKINPTEFQVFKEIYNRLESIQKENPELLTQIFYSLSQAKIDMTFVMYSKVLDSQGNWVFKLQKFNANAKNPDIKKRNKWVSNFKNSPLIQTFEDDKFSINEDVAKDVYALHNEMQKALNKKDNKEELQLLLHKFLPYFGIQLNSETLNFIGTHLPETNNVLALNSQGLFAKNGLINILLKNLDKAIKNEINDINKNSLLLNNTNKYLKALIQADNHVSLVKYESMRVAGKNINSFTMYNSIYNTLDKLKNDEDYINKLLNTPITSNSFILEMLKSNEDFSKYFSVTMKSLEALKISGTESREDMGPVEMSDIDTFNSTFALFAHNDGEIKKDSYNNKGIKLRKGSISFPALSDSSQSPTLNTVLVNLQNSNFNADGKLNENIIEFIFEKTVKNEIARIFSFLSSGIKTNIVGYDTGATFITSIPVLNNLIIEIPSETRPGENIKVPLRYLLTQEKNYTLGVDGFLNKEGNEHIKEAIYKGISDFIKQEVERFAHSTDLMNFFKIDNEYLKLKDDKIEGVNGPDVSLIDDKKALSLFDFVINNFIGLNEIQNLFAGDVAMYFKDKNYDKFFEKDFPIVTFEEILENIYPNEAEKIRKELEDYPGGMIKYAIDKKEIYPALGAAVETQTGDVFENYGYVENIANEKINQFFKDEVLNNLSKRLKELISPGSKMPNLTNSNQTYQQIMLNDIENSSEVLEYLAELYYPETFKDYKNIISEFKKLDDIYENARSEEESKRHKKLLKQISEVFPRIAPFLKNATTDAQEYTTWHDNLNQLRSQGRITQEEFKAIFDKYAAQSEDIDKYGYITEQNKWQPNEKELQRKAVMQVSKPLYSGLHLENIEGKHPVARYIYIKSSSFPLTPELTAMFPKLNAVRKNMERLQDINKETGEVTNVVRASYMSANKVGAVKNSISINDLYNPDLDLETISKAIVPLNKDNFYIQQDKPYHSDENAENGVPDYVTRATQFEKIILGDGISKINRPIFPNLFDSQILEEAGIKLSENGNLTGPQLKTLYSYLYKKEQANLQQKLFDELGITDYSDIASGKPEVMKKLVNKIKKRLNNKQDYKMLELQYNIEYTNRNGKRAVRNISESEYFKLYEKSLNDGVELPVIKKASFKIPLYMMPNSNKFESVLNSIINKNNINLKLPGFQSPVASQEGFDIKGFEGEEHLEKMKKAGLVVTDKFDPKKGLQATTTKDGKLISAQVFMANRYKIFNKEKGQYEYINMKDFVKEDGTIDNEKLPQELLSLFSFRIPTSSHQSGVTLEVVGFLPHTSADLMIVPKDHTTQIGEDYDIDTRFTYNYHYFLDGEGRLKKLTTSDMEISDEVSKSYKKAYKYFAEKIIKQYTENKDVTPFIKHNMKLLLEVAELNHLLDNWTNPDYSTAKLELQEKLELNRKLNKYNVIDYIQDLKLEILPDFIEENQAKNKELSSIVDSLKQELELNKDTLLNYYMAKYQKANAQKVLENNIVSLYNSVFTSPDSQVQGLINKVLSTDSAENTAKYIDKVRNSEKGQSFSIHSYHTQRAMTKLGNAGKIGIGEHSNAVTQNSILQQSEEVHNFEITPFYLGNILVDGKLGKIENYNTGDQVSALGMEDQNSATDNQKLQIMGRRNENKHTMGILKILHAMGIDKEKPEDKFSYSSMLLSQKLLVDLVNEVDKNNSITVDSSNITLDDAIKMRLKYLTEVMGVKLDDKDRKSIGKSLTFERLNENILSNDYNIDEEVYLLEVFQKLLRMSKSYNELQRFTNIESYGLNTSYFNVIEKANYLETLYALKFRRENIIPDEEQLYTIENIIESTESENITITNADKLFGDIELVNIDSNPEEYERLINEGYIFVKNHSKGSNYKLLVKPAENNFSHKIITSLSMGYNMYNSIFPYDGNVLNSMFERLENNFGSRFRNNVIVRQNIMQGLKSYIYTNNSTLFPEGVDVERKKLFFDTENNKSLATRLLEMSNNSKYRNLFNKPFFRDLEFNINKKNHPSTITFNNSDISKTNLVQIYNQFERMMKDRKHPEYKELLKELLQYSLLANQHNGATGFLNHLPVSLLEKYKVTDGISKATTGTEFMQTIMYSGPVKALENFLGVDFDEFGRINLEDFNINNIVNNNKKFVQLLKQTNKSLEFLTGQSDIIRLEGNILVLDENFAGLPTSNLFERQFIQHNPKLLVRLKNGVYSYGKKMPSKRVSLEQDNKSLKYFRYEDKDGRNYIYMREYGNTYVLIPTLGSHNFNEYNVKDNGVNSLVGKNSVDNIDINDSNIIEDRNDFNSIMSSGKIKLLSLANRFKKGQTLTLKQLNLNDTIKNEFSDLLNYFGKLVDYSEIKIKLGEESDKYTAYYNNGTITLNPNLFSGSRVDMDYVMKLIAEETIHHITSNLIGKFISFKGVNPETMRVEYDLFDNVKEIPSEIINLVSIYNEAIKKMVEIYGKDIVLDKINNRKKGDNILRANSQEEQDRQNDLYRISNFHEFFAGLFFKDEHFSKVMAETTYKSSGKTILRKLLDNLFSLLRKYLPQSKHDSITTQAVINMSELLENIFYIKNDKEQKFKDMKPFKLSELGIDENGQLKLSKQFSNIIKKHSEIKNNVKDTETVNSFINYSGGALGADTYWQEVGNKHGVKTVNYTTNNYDSLSNEEKQQIENQYQEVTNFLGRNSLDKNSYAGKLVRRDMMQANSGDSIFGVTELIAPDIKGRKGYKNRKKHIIPEGGTAYAIARGILSGKPTYVYNQSDEYGLSKGWYKWENGDFVQVEEPTLTNNFTGIGTREINEDGKKAIESVYNKTFNSQTTIESSKLSSPVIDNSSTFVEEILNCK